MKLAVYDKDTVAEMRSNREKIAQGRTLLFRYWEGEAETLRQIQGGCVEWSVRDL